jgi:hypothetical protein
MEASGVFAEAYCQQTSLALFVRCVIFIKVFRRRFASLYAMHAAVSGLADVRYQGRMYDVLLSSSGMIRLDVVDNLQVVYYNRTNNFVRSDGVLATLVSQLAVWHKVF